VHYSSGKAVFYQDGVRVGTIAGACLAGGELNVVFSHDADPELGGFNNPSNWDTSPYNGTASTASMDVEYFRYWETRLATNTATTSTTSTTTTTTTTTEGPTTTIATTTTTTTTTTTCVFTCCCYLLLACVAMMFARR
jgi:hypothetical protein